MGKITLSNNYYDENESNPKKYFLIGLLIFIIILVGLLILAFNGFGNVDNEPKEPEEKPTTTTIEEIDISSSEVEDAMANFGLLAISEDELTKYDVYNVNKLTIYGIIETLGNIISEKDSSKLSYCGNTPQKALTLDKLNEYLSDYITYELTEDDISENAVKGTFEFIEGNKKGSIIKENDNSTYSLYIFDGKYYIHSSVCDGAPQGEIKHTKITKAETDVTSLYIYEKRAFYEITNNTKPTEDEIVKKVEFAYYKDYAKTDLVEKVFGTVTSLLNNKYEQKEELTWDKYNTYKYTFTLKDDVYYFYQYELLED